MKIRTLACGFVLGAVSAADWGSSSLAGSWRRRRGAGGAGGVGGAQDMRAMMQQWIKSTKPSDHHKALEGSIGTWDTTTKIWMEGPAGEPVVTPGVAESKWVLDGRFVMEEMKSEFPLAAMSGGQAKNIPWNGMGIFGYDNFRNMYVGFWADTMGTQLLTMKGMASPDGKTFTYYGEMDEPEMGVIGRTVKYQTKIIDNDTHVFTIYDLHAGDNYKTVEVTYKRKK